MDDGDGLVLIAQEAHAHLAGDLAAVLARPPARRSAFIAAARLHDNGWREADTEPTVDADGAPHVYRTTPDERYAQVWRRGISRAAAVDPLVGLLVGLHGARFFGSGEHTERLLADERDREAGVLTHLGLGGTPTDLPPEVAEASDWIAFLDLVSLLVCEEFGDTFDADAGGTSYRVTRAPGLLHVDPWPFRVDVVPAVLPARRVPARTYATDEALRAALSAAPPVTVRREIRPA